MGEQDLEGLDIDFTALGTAWQTAGAGANTAPQVQAAGAGSGGAAVDEGERRTVTLADGAEMDGWWKWDEAAGKKVMYRGKLTEPDGYEWNGQWNIDEATG